MAISPMQKVTLLTTRTLLEPVMSMMQRLKRVQTIDLNDALQVLDEEEKERVLSYLLSDTQRTDQESLLALDQHIVQIEQSIKQLESYQSKDSLWQQLKKEKPFYDYEAFIQAAEAVKELDIIEDVTQQTARLKEIDRQIDKLIDNISEYQKWQSLDIIPAELESFQYIQAIVGTVHNIESNQYINEIKNHPMLEYKIVFLNDVEYGIVVFFQGEYRDEIEAFLESIHFKPLKYPYLKKPQEQLQMWQEECQQLKEEKQQRLQQMRSTGEMLQQLQLKSDYVKTKQARIQAQTHTVMSEHLVAIEGWIEVEEYALFQSELHKQFNESVVVRSHEIDENEMEKVPIRLKNHSLIQPFEMITKMYALPKYNEMDPTPFVAPFYFVFFGMMVADFGYGLVISLICALGMMLFKVSDNIKSSLKFGLLLGISICIWGIIYGSAFGFTLPIQLINPNENVMLVLGISVVLGLIHIYTALALNIYLKVKQKNYVEAYSGGLGWILLLSGLLLLASGMLGDDYAVWATIGKVLAIVNTIGIVVASCIKSGGLGGLGWGLYDLYGVTGYVGDIVSYTRLMALGLSGGSIALAFNMIIGFLPGYTRLTIGIVLFLILHALSLFLALLSAYVHGARLIFVEFFAKFYEGGGKPFKPLTISEEYITIKKMKK